MGSDPWNHLIRVINTHRQRGEISTQALLYLSSKESVPGWTPVGWEHEHTHEHTHANTHTRTLLIIPAWYFLNSHCLIAPQKSRASVWSAPHAAAQHQEHPLTVAQETSGGHWTTLQPSSVTCRFGQTALLSRGSTRRVRQWHISSLAAKFNILTLYMVPTGGKARASFGNSFSLFSRKTTGYSSLGVLFFYSYRNNNMMCVHDAEVIQN